VDVALKWQALGALRLHLVDLDAAKSGKPENLDIVRRITQVLRIPVELGGGIRDRATVELVLKAGVQRVVLGTAAVEKPELVRALCTAFGEAVVVGIDARAGMLAVRGWLGDTDANVFDVVPRMVRDGVRRIIYTDIERDGTLTQPNFETVGALVRAATVPVIASGGVAGVEHLKKLKALGVEGVIVGKALYTGDLKLEEALAAVGVPSPSKGDNSDVAE
jgi:phosphoribosylformimino-5-aminoimidazole carboxamide ribotide isomerase